MSSCHGQATDAYRNDVPAPEQEDGGRARFPVLDPEPPPRPWWWRLCAGAGVLAVAAAVAALIVFWPFAPGSRPAAAASARVPAALDRGRIVVQEANGDLALADPDGTHVTTLSELGTVGQATTASPDDRYLLAAGGEPISISSGPRLTPHPSQAQVTSSNGGTAQFDPFADHDQDTILLQDYGDPTSSVQNPVWVASFATGKAVSLGAADEAAGDPQTAGAFVSVAAPPVASTMSTQVNPDSEIDLRVAGQPPVVVATAAAINSDLGVVNEPVALIPFPDPAGDKILVVVRAAAQAAFGGLVVLSRSGQMLGATAPSMLGGFIGEPAWSPSGRALAYVDFSPVGQASGQGSTGNVLVIWPTGEQPTRISFRTSSSQGRPRGGRCVWSPGGSAVLCSAAEQAGYEWVVAKTGARSVTVVPGPGQPVAWLPGEASR